MNRRFFAVSSWIAALGATLFWMSPAHAFLPFAFWKNASGPSDPSWSSVVLLMHFDGTNGSTTFTDQKSHTFSAAGASKISTAASQFGGASGYFDATTGTTINTPFVTDFDLGSGDFTIEFFYRAGAATPNGTLFIGPSNGGPYSGFAVNVSSGGNIVFYSSFAGTAWNIAGAVVGSWSNSAFNHYAIVRSGNTLLTFKNGTIVTNTASAFSGAVYYGTTYNFYIGSDVGSQLCSGYIDEFRITKGVARYTSAFTAPTSAFPNH